MTIGTLVKRSEYHDSVTLMLVARELAKLPGVLEAAVVMATEANKSILEQSGLLTAEAEAATPNDLVIAVSAKDGAGDAALGEGERLLQKKGDSGTGEGAVFRPKTIRGAVKSASNANVAVISVAGRYAADEAWDALRRGLHVLLFSDNVTLDDEIVLKKYARDHGLLFMGAGAGTAILNGVALGFANVVPSGPVGLVSAAGTGLQEVSALLAKYGVGITQGLGTGGRDLKEEVGGIMMLEGLKALQTDPATKVITLISKPPAASVVEKIMAQVALSDKPTVVCFLGGDPKLVSAANAVFATTLHEAALWAARKSGADVPHPDEIVKRENRDLVKQAGRMRAKLKTGQRYLRGLFSGGTLCYEAQLIWREALAQPVLSNAPLNKANRLPESTRSHMHTAVDLGEEEFTVGRPHPMIDNDLRIRRLLQEARDPQAAVIMLDVVLGYGAHPDPASELGPAVRQARKLAREAGRELIVVASVTGTEHDPQGLSRQTEALKAAGVVLCNSNAAAARLAALIVSRRLAGPKSRSRLSKPSAKRPPPTNGRRPRTAKVKARRG